MSSQADLVVEILAGFPANPAQPDTTGLTSLIVGRADNLQFDHVSDTFELTGRDYSARFLDNRIGEVYKNQTAAQVINSLASRRGLTANVTGGAIPIGSFYEIDRARLSGDRTEWDVICWIAQELQSTVYVLGTTLYFRPNSTPENTTPYPIFWSEATGVSASKSSVTDLKFERCLTLARDIIVIVQSHHSKTKQTYKATSKRLHTTTTNKASGAFSSPPQTYVFTYPGLDQKACQVKADAICNQISMNEMKLTATLPGDVTLDPHGLIQVSGTQTAFDQIYYRLSVQRTMSVSGGFLMTVQARNNISETVIDS
jgi:hypothetical protein